MAQLYYRYSTMNAGKSLELIKVAYNYEEKGKTVLVLTSAVDDRYGEGKITSRVGIQRDAVVVRDETDILQVFSAEGALDGTLGTDVHKDRGLDGAVGTGKFTAPGLAFGFL